MCPANSSRVLTQCVCNSGFYASNNACLQCPSATFYDSQARNCLPCSSYCLTCQSTLLCVNCSPGFYLTQSVTNGQFTTQCSEVCGDSKRYSSGCDDGNTVGGDGCSNVCQVETGWSCSGGSADSKDSCVRQTQNAVSGAVTRIQAKQNVLFVNAVYQNILVSDLPSALASDGCPACPHLLRVAASSGPADLQVAVNYIPNTTHNFVVTLICPSGLAPISLEVSLNPVLASFFTAADMSQKIPISINPSALAALNLITAPGQTSSLAISAPTLDKSGQVESIPATVLNIFLLPTS